MEKMKAVIYARCSTDEARQDVEVQLKELRRYCKAYNWNYDEVQEYGSGYKGKQPKLEAILEKVRNGQYNAFIVYSLDRSGSTLRRSAGSWIPLSTIISAGL